MPPIDYVIDDADDYALLPLMLLRRHDAADAVDAAKRLFLI